eukprot:3773476-Rhodomonas_salina.2
MAEIGEARRQYASHVPLIGIATWGIVEGREHLCGRNGKAAGKVATNLTALGDDEQETPLVRGAIRV